MLEQRPGFQCLCYREGSNALGRGNLEGFKGKRGGVQASPVPPTPPQCVPSRGDFGGSANPRGFRGALAVPELVLSLSPGGSWGSGTPSFWLLGGVRGRLLRLQGPGDAYRAATGQERGTQGDEAQPRLRGQEGTVRDRD